MLTVPFFDLARHKHVFNITYDDFDVNSCLYRYFLECKYCNRWCRIESEKELTVKDFIKIGFNIEINKKEE